MRLDFLKGLGFTKNEARVIMFLMFVFLLGSALYIFQGKRPEAKIFNYRSSDSSFMNQRIRRSYDSGDQQKAGSTSPGSPEIKRVSREKKRLPGKNSISLNNATKADLMRLPGVGEKTALKIIELRRQKGHFRKLEELKEVNGIGEKKFGKILPYLKEIGIE